MIIAALALLVALMLIGETNWPQRGATGVFALAILFGVGYTIYSEWVNTTIRGGWSYDPLMPRLRWLGTGLAPLAQWVVVPSLALSTALWRYR